MPTSTIERRTLTAEPILFIRRNVPRADLPEAIAESLGTIYAYAERVGLELAGAPFTRYTSADDERVTAEIGFRLSSPGYGEGEIEAGLLADGEAAVAVHEGAYDDLGATYGALERWMTGADVRPRGAPWEVYLTDPGEHPDPAEWRTEVIWPFAE